MKPGWAYTSLLLRACCAAAMQAGWGDDAKDQGATNPYFDAELYTEYSTSTQRNLARVDEHRIDYDLLEDLIAYIDTTLDDGAVLVFLPGNVCCPSNVQANVPSASAAHNHMPATIGFHLHAE